MNFKTKSAFVTTIFVAILLALQIIYLVDHRIQESSYREEQLSLALADSTTILSDRFDQLLDELNGELLATAVAFENDNYPYDNDAWLDNHINYHEQEILLLSQVPSSEIAHIQLGQWYFGNEANLILTHPIQEAGEVVAYLIVRLNQNDIETLIDDLSADSNTHYAIITAQGQFLWGDYATIDDWLGQVEVTNIDNLNPSPVLTLYNKQNVSFIQDDTAYYGYFIFDGNGLYTFTTITQSSFQQSFASTQLIFNTMFYRSLIINIILSLYIIIIEILHHRSMKRNDLQFTALHTSGGIVVVGFDETLPIQYGNDGFYNVIGYTEKEIRAKFEMQLSRIIYEKDIFFCEDVIKSLREKTKGDFKIRLKSKNRGLIWVHLNCSYHQAQRETITMVLLDITESKTLNTEIKSLISTIPGGVLKTTADNWKILFASDSLAILMGYEPIEFKERFIYFNECVHNLDLAYFLQTIGKKPDVLYLELRLIKKDGSAAWVAINATKSLLENNESIYQSVIIDSTSQKEVSLELKKELDRSTIVMEMIDEFICEYFVDENRLISSRKCAEVLGLDLIVEDFSLKIQNTKVIHPDDIPAFLEYFTHFDEAQKENRLDLRLRHKNGEYIWYMLKGATLYEDGLPYKIIAKLTNINEEKKKITALMDISVRDSFTGVYNAGNTPRFINEYLQSEDGVNQHALLMIDIDNFKNVNDKYGHDVGDKLIKEFSSRIITFFGSGALIGRVGGDEFVVLIKDIAEDKVFGYVEKLKRKLYEEYVFDGIIITFSTSFGIAIIPRDGNQYEILFKKADLACYQAKNHGKNTIRVFTDDMLASPLNLTTIAYDSSESSLMMMDCIGLLGASESIIDGIQDVLDQVNDFYHFDGTFIFEFHDEANSYGHTMTYRQTNHRIEDKGLLNKTYRLSNNLVDLLSRNPLLFLNDPSTIGEEFPNLYQLFNDYQDRSGLLCGIQEASQLKAIFAFTSQSTIQYPKHQDVTPLVTIARLVMSYIQKLHERRVQALDAMVYQEILKDKDVNAYVVDEDTYQISYLSPRLSSLKPNAKINDICYKTLKGREEVCSDCPMQALKGGRTIATHRYDEETKQWLGINAKRLNSGAADTSNTLIYSYDITSYIEQVTLIDPLTGLYNFTKFIVEGDKLIKSNHHDQYVLIYADINDFRYINEVYGYQTGNQVLYGIARVLEAEMRKDEICGHVNGDRFLLMLKYNNQTSLKRRLLNLSDRCAASKNAYLGTMTISFTSGAHVLPPEGIEIVQAINGAELAHKTAKAKKNGELVFYNEDLLSNLAHIKLIENKMVEALKNHEFLLFMQPKYDIRTSEIIGLEALTRWASEGRMLGPSEFIPIFEKNGFINRMTYYIAEEVFKTIRHWLDHRLTIVPIAINISYNYLISDFFCTDFIELLKTYKIPPQLIEIELTETVFKENVEIIIDRMTRMKNLGFKIAIDDFGSGYSSLILLRDLPIDILKLDKGFFKNNIVGKKEMIIIENIVRMAQELGIDIVSEGVESEEQIKFLKKIGCHYVQGYYFAKPMEIEKAIEILNPKKGEI